MDLGTITFHNARASGTLFKHLGSGVPDYIGFFGANGLTQNVEVGSFGQTTFMVDSNGEVPGYLGSESGKLTPTRYISDTQVKISGFPTKLLTQVNVFHPTNLNTYPNFLNRASGCLMIQYTASGVSAVNTFNAKLFAYDQNLSINDAPQDITVAISEINGSGIWANAAESGQWFFPEGNNSPFIFANHSASNGYRAEHKHIWVAMISVKPDSIGTFNDWALGFSLQFV